MKKLILFMLFSIMIYSTFTFAQSNFSAGPQVSECIYHDSSPPLRDMPEAPLSRTPWQNGIIPLRSSDFKFDDQYQNDPSLQNFMEVSGDDFVVQTWDGIAAQGYAPPDPTGDVGSNHYMAAVNVRFQIWNKTGTSLLGPLNLGTIWSGFPGPWSSSLNDGDAIVLYDEVAGRWFIGQFSLPNYPNGPSYIIMAVSQTGDPTGSWYRYGFTYSYGIPDYPKFGIWPDGYYMSANAFSSGSLNYSGTIIAAFERSKMLIGATAQTVTFTRSAASTWTLLPSDWNGATVPPAGAPNYFAQMHESSWYGGSDGVDIFSFTVNWTTPANSTLTGPVLIPTTAFSQLSSGIPQQGTTQLLADMSDKLMNRLDYRNFGTHQSMVACHTINAGSGRAGVRWYEFRNTGSGWSLYQQGTFAPADGLHRWMGSIAINAVGQILIGYSVSSSSMYPAIRYTGRYASDPIGQMTIPEETIHQGTGSQTGGLDRWGDYTQMSVDPNGSNFWYINQYQPSTGSFNWRTRIANINLITAFQLTVNISDGWNMVSIPGLHPTDQNVGTWWQYRDLGANVFRYASGYQPVTVAAPGIGYWMKHTGARTYNTGEEWPAGGIQTVTHAPIAGSSGWNLIGGYEMSVLTANITTIPAGLQTGPVYKYSAGYAIATNLDPGYGYWIKLSAAGQIIIPETLVKDGEPVAYFPENWGKIVLTDAAGINYTLYAVKGEVDLSQYELPPAPPTGMFDIRYSSGRIAEDLNSAIKTIDMSGVTYPLAVRVEGMDIRLMDETGKTVNLNLKDGEDVVISDGTIQKLMVSGEMIPAEYALEQNYPNPFNPSTTIKYSIPEDGFVKLAVYNMLGEEVTTLINSQQKAGRYEVNFNATGLSSGVYVYRIEAANYTASKKLMLMK
jgi:hypothetical protein